MLLPILFSVSYLLACFGIATTARNKKVGSQRTFHIAVLFTPVVAIIIVLLSPKRAVHPIRVYRCKRCGLEYSDKNISCPACAKKGLNIFVKESVKGEVS